MLLKSGLKLYSDLPAITEQVMINDGTMLPRDGTGLYYHPGSYIPRPVWRNLDPAEAKLVLTKNRQTDFRKSVYVGDIPEGLREEFISLGLHTCTQVDQVLPEIRKKEQEVIVVNKKLDAFLRPFSSVNKYHFHRVTRAMPDRETITCHYIGGKFIYIGLHIDQSRRFTPHTAYKSGNRISINLSKETRYLAFVNLSLIQAFRMIREKMPRSAIPIDPNNIASLFFSHYPDYPVLRIAQKPYQYYVAPTDNCFHDATTLGNKEIDITLVYTGIFDMLN